MSDVGFFTFAQGDVYLRCAYALALSLKMSQRKHSRLSVGVTPGAEVPEKYRQAFDKVIEIPLGDDAANSTWKLENEWKAFMMSPYEETIKLDADMLFCEDISHYISAARWYNFCFALNVLDYRGQVITSDECRRVFTVNVLPNVYSAFFYFNRHEEAANFFLHAEDVFRKWQYFRLYLQAAERPHEFSTDVAYALTKTLFHYEDHWRTSSEQARLKLHLAPMFVHMKGELQGWKADPYQARVWPAWLPVQLTNEGKLLIGGFYQKSPVHYHHKEFVTDEMLYQLERMA